MTVSSANVIFDLSAVDEAQLARDASARFERLLAFDERILEREELRAAGVSSRTLGSLYPYDFGALAGGITELLAAGASPLKNPGLKTSGPIG